MQLRAWRRADGVDVTGYLDRLGLVGIDEPSAAALTEIHRAHVERIAYNTVDIHLGRATTVDPVESAQRLVTHGRGGYCFHLNGALAALLDRLGFHVRMHRGGVWRQPDQPPLEPFANHLALTVHDLPAPENPTGVWFVDVGLGDALHEPVPLRSGTIRQHPFAYRLEASPLVPGGWRFRHDPAGSFPGMDFATEPASPAAFAGSHQHLSTSAESGFVQRFSAVRRDRAGVDKLVGCTLHHVDASGRTETVLLNPSDWYGALLDLFRIGMADVDAEARAALWRRTLTAHEAWERSQQ
ncbi:MAG TPA: arylamine N-acetyltransferase [Micromonosporaceae bacterium]